MDMECCSCHEEYSEWNMERTKFGMVCPNCQGAYEDYVCMIHDERVMMEKSGDENDRI